VTGANSTSHTPSSKPVHQRFRHRQSEARLAATAYSGDGDETVRSDEIADLQHVSLAAEKIR
jgi:hypothetical protein